MTSIKAWGRAVLRQVGIEESTARLFRTLTPEGRARERQLREQEAKALNLYRQFIAPGDLVFDVGAHMGVRVATFLALGARVIAVEPQPSCLEHLRQRFGRRPEVRIIAAGLDQKPGQQKLYVGPRTLIASMSQDFMSSIQRRHEKFAQHRWSTEIEVEVMTLDILIERTGLPAFIKIDVEGFESRVLAGLSNAVRAVSFEYTPEYIEPALESARRLEALGPYEFNWSVEESMTLTSETWLTFEQITEVLQRLQAENRSGDVYARLRR